MWHKTHSRKKVEHWHRKVSFPFSKAKPWPGSYISFRAWRHTWSTLAVCKNYLYFLSSGSAEFKLLALNSCFMRSSRGQTVLSKNPPWTRYLHWFQRLLRWYTPQSTTRSSGIAKKAVHFWWIIKISTRQALEATNCGSEMQIMTRVCGTLVTRLDEKLTAISFLIRLVLFKLFTMAIVMVIITLIW